MTQEIFTETTSEQIGHRLRAIRIAQGLSLAQIEKSSRGSLMAATLGSYERADRSLSIDRALEIAHFYHLPLSHLLQEPQESRELEGRSSGMKIVFDLRKIRALSQNDSESEKVIYFLSQLAQKRSDWNGEILSIRSSDIATLAILLRISESLVITWLEERHLLLQKFTEPIHP